MSYFIKSNTFALPFIIVTIAVWAMETVKIIFTELNAFCLE